MIASAPNPDSSPEGEDLAVPASMRDDTVAPARKQIMLRDQDLRLAEKISKTQGVSPVTSRVLAARGHEPGQELDIFLETDPSKAARDGLPKPDILGGLEEAMEILRAAVADGGRIAIANDFDVDGLTGGVQLYRAFRESEIPARLFVPDRFKEGYGLNNRIIDDAVKQGCSLLITVDYGTSNKKEIEYAKSKGLKVIVIDHHAVKEAPPADAFINPQQCGFADGIMCASALAWYFLARARRVVPQMANVNPWEYMPYAGIGTICDMVPLVGPNRIIAKTALTLLPRTEHVGLQALMKEARIFGKVNSQHVGFGIGPRINAAGRMIDGTMVAKLFTTEDPKEAKKFAKELNRMNSDRQETQAAVTNLARQKVLRASSLGFGLFESDPDFHIGVVGLAAQGLMDEFYLPTAIMGMEKGLFKGSLRGVHGLSVKELIFAIDNMGLLESGGGHDAAGGWSFKPENYDAVREAFLTECERQLGGVRPQPRQRVDTIATLEETTPALVKELGLLDPIGMGNAGAVLLYEDMTVKSAVVHKNSHLRCILTDGKKDMLAWKFRCTSDPDLREGKKLHVAAKPDEFRGTTNLKIEATMTA